VRQSLLSLATCTVCISLASFEKSNCRDYTGWRGEKWNIMFIYLFIYLFTTHEAANSGKYLLNGGFVCVDARGLLQFDGVT